MSAESADTATLGQIANELARLKEENQRLRERVEDLEEQAAENERLRERVETLEQQVAEMPDVEWDGRENQIENLHVDNVPLGLIVNRHGERLNEHEERVDGLVEDAGARIDAEMEADLTPIERVHLLGRDSAAVPDTVEMDRALTIYEHLPEWSKAAGNGRLILRTGDEQVLSQLRTARPDDETLNRWEMVYRACEVLAKFANDKIEWHGKDKSGKNRLVVPADVTLAHSQTLGAEGE